MIKTQKYNASFYLKCLVNFLALVSGALLGHSGSLFVATTVFDTRIGRLFADNMTKIFPYQFPLSYRFFIYHGFGWLIIIDILIFLVGTWFLLRIFRKFIALFSDIRTKLNLSWPEYLKTYFSLGFWFGVCGFIFIWLFFVPIFVDTGPGFIN